MRPSVAIDLRIEMLSGLAPTMALIRALTLIVASLIAASSVTTSAFSQAPPAESGWSVIRDLPQQTRIHVTSRRMDKTCKFLFVDEEKLVCSSGRTPSAVLLTFNRYEVSRVHLTFLAASEFTGYTIRSGSIAHLHTVTKGRSDNGPEPLSDAILGLAVFADRLMSGGIGTSMDLICGSTVYQRPEPQL